MTPSDIEILIHCYVSPSPHPRKDAPAVKESLESFVRNGLIEPYAGGGYSTTDRGSAHIEQLCSLPWPVQKWVNQQNEIIGSDAGAL